MQKTIKQQKLMLLSGSLRRIGIYQKEGAAEIRTAEELGKAMDVEPQTSPSSWKYRRPNYCYKYSMSTCITDDCTAAAPKNQIRIHRKRNKKKHRIRPQSGDGTPKNCRITATRYGHGKT